MKSHYLACEGCRHQHGIMNTANCSRFSDNGKGGCSNFVDELGGGGE